MQNTSTGKCIFYVRSPRYVWYTHTFALYKKHVWVFVSLVCKYGRCYYICSFFEYIIIWCIYMADALYLIYFTTLHPLESFGWQKLIENTRKDLWIETIYLMVELFAWFCDLQVGGSGVLVSPLTYIFEEEPPHWRQLLNKLKAT